MTVIYVFLLYLTSAGKNEDSPMHFIYLYSLFVEKENLHTGLTRKRCIDPNNIAT